MRGWQIDWSPAAMAGLLNLPRQHAERVDEAVMLYASTGRGNTSRIADERLGVWLRASGYVVRLRLYPAYQTVGVLYLFRSDR
jgi:hypothetical protein